jgi:hypothetical protein
MIYGMAVMMEIIREKQCRMMLCKMTVLPTETQTQLHCG